MTAPNRQLERWLLAGALGPLLIAIAAQWASAAYTERELSSQGLKAQAETLSRLAADLATAPLEFSDRESLQEVLQSVAHAPDFSFVLVVHPSGELVSYVGDPGLREDRAHRAAKPVQAHTTAEEGVLEHTEMVTRAGKILGRLVVGLSTLRVESSLRNQRARDAALVLAALLIAVGVVGSLLRSIRERNQRRAEDLALLRRTGRLARVGGWEFHVLTGRTKLSAEARLALGECGIEQMRALMQAARAEIAERVARGTPFDLELQLSTQPTRWLRIQAEASDGKRILGALQDVTEQRLAREEAFAASKAKSQFLANTSHEMRTPLNGILGMTTLALETELSGEQRSYLEAVRLSGRNMLATVNDLLDLSRVESGKLTLELTPSRLDAVVIEAVRNLSPQAQAKSVELAVSIDPSLELRRHVDPIRLTQVVNNLVGNAVKFTHQGEIEVTLAPGSGPSEVLLSVRDTGIGVPKERQVAIFEAFTQADGSTSRQYGGTGLGLTITRELVKLMGGSLTLESEVGHGSTFSARLQLEPAPDRTPRAALPLRRALVLAPNATTRRGAELLLARLGVAVESAASAAAAEGLRGTFDATLVDVACQPQLEQLDCARTGQRFVLVPFGLSGAITRGARLLSKPLLASELLEALQRPAAAQGPNATLATPLPARALSVLLAEDNAVNATLARKLIEKAGHTVTHVWNGAAAVEATKGHSFDLVLMDMQMPELDGLEATRRIRQSEQGTGHHLFVVAMTANAMKADEALCRAAGMDDFICKPIDFAKLRRLLDEQMVAIQHVA